MLMAPAAATVNVFEPSVPPAVTVPVNVWVTVGDVGAVTLDGAALEPPHAAAVIASPAAAEI
jgi:hypothetical protein